MRGGNEGSHHRGCQAGGQQQATSIMEAREKPGLDSEQWVEGKFQGKVTELVDKL